MALPTREEVIAKFDEAHAKRVAREQRQADRDAAASALTLADAELADAQTQEAVHYQQAKDRLQEYVTGVELVPVPPPPHL